MVNAISRDADVKHLWISDLMICIRVIIIVCSVMQIPIQMIAGTFMGRIIEKFDNENRFNKT